MSPTLDERIEHFLDNDFPHMQRAITTLNVKMWFVLTIIMAVALALYVPQLLAAGSK